MTTATQRAAVMSLGKTLGVVTSQRGSFCRIVMSKVQDLMNGGEERTELQVATTAAEANDLASRAVFLCCEGEGSKGSIN
jgi:hypothetical protein